MRNEPVAKADDSEKLDIAWRYAKGTRVRVNVKKSRVFLNEEMSFLCRTRGRRPLATISATSWISRDQWTLALTFKVRVLQLSITTSSCPSTGRWFLLDITLNRDLISLKIFDNFQLL